MAKETVISNSSLNSYGFRVLTEGIDVEQFRRNPILLWGHHTTFRGTTDEVLPIGRIENLRVEGDNLIGTPVFDEQDDFAVRIRNKFENGFLKMVSAGLDVIETSSDPTLTVQGQRRATVTKSKLREVSIVDIGANDDALALYDAGGERIKLNASGEIPAIPEIAFKNDLNIIKMKTVALKLGLPETAGEAEILTKIGVLQTEAGQAVELRTKLEAQRESEINAEVETAIKQKRITADLREHFRTLGKTAGVEALRTTLEAVSPAVKPTEVIGKGGKAAPATGDYKALGEVPAEERIRLRSEEPERYAKLYKAEYGIQWDFEQ